MLIHNIHVRDYKGYFDSGVVDLASGFNMVVGQNDAGKSALLEALSLRLENQPHRSAAARRQRLPRRKPASSVDVTVGLTRDEIGQALGAVDLFQIPLERDEPAGYQESFDRFRNSLQDNNLFRFSVDSRSMEPGMYGHRLNAYGEESESGLVMAATLTERGYSYYAASTFPNREGHFGNVLGEYVRSKIYMFRAERLNVGLGNLGGKSVLEGDLGNLPDVLNSLQGNPARFYRFNDLVRTIFPHIRNVSAVPRQGGRAVEILVWPTGELEDEELAIPLAQCGSGVGQVLGILYVVVTSAEPQTIIIDEPQSFLHPGAARKLMEILLRYEHHQFVLSTHSPAVVAAIPARTITLVRKEGAESRLEKIDVGYNRDLQLFLSQLGAQLSDVFGADRVLWVEGKTEELAYPVILRQVAKRDLIGTRIVGVVSTGDLEGPQAKKTYEIYKRLSQAWGLLPPAVGFVFDREERTEQERTDLIRASDKTVAFTKRRMYENYLLNPAAISHVLSTCPGSGRPIDPGVVKQCLERYRTENRHVPRRLLGGDWVENTHAAQVLKDIFAELSEGTIEFRKTDHSLRLTEWIAEHAPGDFAELAATLVAVLEKGAAKLSGRMLAGNDSARRQREHLPETR